MQFGNRDFSPRPLIVLLYLLVGGCMLALGNWQLSRADQKIALQAQADAALAEPAVSLAELDLSTDDFVYRRVRVIGRFETERQLLWDNRVAGGVPGYEVITPFRLHSGELLLVNRGWLPASPDRQTLPEIAFESPSEQELLLEGMLTRPSIGFSRGPAVEALATWPRRLQHFAFDELQSLMGGTLVPGLLQDVSTSGVPMYNNVWVPAASGPERHYGYAFQWFAMFIALSGLFVFLNLRRVSNPE